MMMKRSGSAMRFPLIVSYHDPPGLYRSVVLLASCGQTSYTGAVPMKMRRALPLAVITMTFFLASCSDTSLVFLLQDSVSGGWVWDAMSASRTGCS